jgi:hypothetical protein
MFNPNPFSRRSLFKGAAATALLPLLEADLARADCIPAGRRRLVVMHWNNGVQDYVSPTLDLPASMVSLTPYKSDLLVPLGLFNKIFDDNASEFFNEAHHSPASLLVAQAMPSTRNTTTPAPTESLDYRIGYQLQQATSSPYPVLNLGVMYEHADYGSPAWEAPGVAANPDDDPYHVFDQLFSGAQMTQPDPAIEQRRLMRKSVLDYVQKDIARFSKKLGTADRQKVDGHLTAIREMEQRLTPQMTAPQCTFPTLGPMYDVHSADNYDKVITAQIDNGVAALAAGMSQVLTLHASSGAGGYVVSWLGYQATGVTNSSGSDQSTHHGLAHDDGAGKTRIDTWFYEKLAYLISKLKSVPEGGGTMFDNTVVLVTNCMDDGNAHDVYNLPWLLAGSCGGFFKTGQALVTNRASHSGVLIGLANAFGVSTAGWADPNYGGELPGLRP